RFALSVARHKTFAVMFVAGLLVVAVTQAISLARIARERTAAEASKDELTLKHVELLMKSDPTAALHALADYHGHEELRRQQLAAEAKGRGVARDVMTPHKRPTFAAVTAQD